MAVILLTASAVAAAAGQLLLKHGADGRQNLSGFLNASIAAGLILYGIGTAIWIYVLSSEKLVNVYAFTALTFVLVYLGSTITGGVSTSRAGLMGIVLILSGLYLLTRYNS